MKKLSDIPLYFAVILNEVIKYQFYPLS